MGWQSLSTLVLQSLQAVTTLAVAAAIGPRAFAIWGVAQILLNARVVLTLGFGEGLIYFDAGSRFRDYVDTAFTATAALVAAVAGLIFAFAPQVADLFTAGFRHADVVIAIRITAIAFAFSTLETIPLAVLERRLDFRRRATVEISTSVLYALLAVGLLVAGAGVWSLIAARLVLTATRLVGFWLRAPVRPRVWRIPHRDILKRLLGYGAFLNGAAILGFVSENLDTVVIGAAAGAHVLGAYALAFVVANLVPTFLSFTLNRVTVPLYAAVRDSRARLQEAWATAVHFCAVVMMPTSLGLLFVAPNAFVDILGANWRPAEPFLRVLALYAIARALGDAGMSLLSGTGRPRQAMAARAVGLAAALATLLPLKAALGATGIALAFAIGRTAVAVVVVAVTREAASRRLTRALPSVLAAALAVGAARLCGLAAPAGAVAGSVELIALIVVYPALLIALDAWVRERAHMVFRLLRVPAATDA
jgi:PST family polysaccharide transporter